MPTAQTWLIKGVSSAVSSRNGSLGLDAWSGVTLLIRSRPPPRDAACGIQELRLPAVCVGSATSIAMATPVPIAREISRLSTNAAGQHVLKGTPFFFSRRSASDMHTAVARAVAGDGGGGEKIEQPTARGRALAADASCARPPRPQWKPSSATRSTSSTLSNSASANRQSRTSSSASRLFSTVTRKSSGSSSRVIDVSWLSSGPIHRTPFGLPL